MHFLRFFLILLLFCSFVVHAAYNDVTQPCPAGYLHPSSITGICFSTPQAMQANTLKTCLMDFVGDLATSTTCIEPTRRPYSLGVSSQTNSIRCSCGCFNGFVGGLAGPCAKYGVFVDFDFNDIYAPVCYRFPSTAPRLGNPLDGDGPSVYNTYTASLVIKSNDRCDFECKSGYELVPGKSIRSLFVDADKQICDPSLTFINNAETGVRKCLYRSDVTSIRPDFGGDYCVKSPAVCVVQVPPFVAYECFNINTGDITSKERARDSTTRAKMLPGTQCTFTATCPNADYEPTLFQFYTKGYFYSVVCDNSARYCNSLTYDSQTGMCSSSVFEPDSILVKCSILDYTYPSACPSGYYGQRCLPCPYCGPSPFSKCNDGKSGTGQCVFKDICQTFQTPLVYNYKSSTGQCDVLGSGVAISQLLQTKVLFYSDVRGYEIMGYAIIASQDGPNTYSLYMYDLFMFDTTSSEANSSPWLCKRFGKGNPGAYVYLPKIFINYITNEPGSNSRRIYLTLPQSFLDTYTCDCPPGWYGRKCETFCTTDPEMNTICDANGDYICNKYSQMNERGECVLVGCPEGLFGPGCSQMCPDCRGNLLLTTCDRNSSSPTVGTCQCPVLGERPNPSNTKCIAIHCGPNDNCSGHKDWCYTPPGADFQFCRCPRGRHGKYCEHSTHCNANDASCEETYEEQSCDCGVRWSDPVSLNSITDYTIVPSGLYTPSFERENFAYNSISDETVSNVVWAEFNTNTDVYLKAYKEAKGSGATWSIPSTFIFSRSRLRSNIDELKDYRTRVRPNQPFKTLEQARYICYTDALGCHGFMYTKRLKIDVDPTSSEYLKDNGYFVTFFVKVPTTTNNNSALIQSTPIFDQFVNNIAITPTQVIIETIDRAYGYRCIKRSFDDFDPYYYFFKSGLRADIEAKFCSATHRHPTKHTCCLKGSTVKNTHSSCDNDVLDKILKISPLTTVAEGDPWIEMARRHWRTEGHRKRYSPNEDCVVTPVMWSSQSRCASHRPGCDRPGPDTGIPCSNQGRCIKNNRNENTYPFDYKCSCDVYDGAALAASRGSEKDLLKWTGLACQIPGVDNCVEPNKPIGQQTICNGDAKRCVNITLPAGSDLTTANPFPKCDCNMLLPSSTEKHTPADGQGDYCQMSRCGNGEGCSNSGECSYDEDTGLWQCKCGEYSEFTGPTCKVDATPCLAQVPTAGFIKCSARGICHEPSAPGLSNVPGFNLTHAWCECTTGNYTGTTCSTPVCDIQYLEPDHGTCNSIGGDVTCYPAWTGPNTRCNTSVCEKSGGIPGSRNKYEPYGICICPIGREMRKELLPVDITCWPTLPSRNGTVCGGPPNTYSRAGTNQNPSSRTQCICSSPDWEPSTYVDPLTGITEPTCVKKCSENGVWNQDMETCVCTPNTKWYNKENGNKRCEDIRCEPNGIFNPETLQCECNSGLFTGSNCESSQCSVCPSCPASSQPRGEVTSSNRCFCYKPYAPSNLATQLDCNSDVCGVNKAKLNPSSNGRAKCDCSGLFYTKNCGVNDVYCASYCMDHFCANGGYPNSPSSFTCDCPFPFKSTGTTKPYCADNICNQPYGIPVHGLPVLNGKSQPGACICMYGFTDNPNTLDTLRCNRHPCANGGAWDSGSLSCVCANGWKGTTCLESTNKTLSCGEHGYPISTNEGKSACTCAPLWTGTLCQQTMCQYGTYDPITISCQCQNGFAGYLCDVYIGPPTKAPSIPTPSPPKKPTDDDDEPWQEQKLKLFHISLAVKYWAAIASVLLTGSIFMISSAIISSYGLLL